MKPERLIKMLPVMFIAYSAGMFALCGVILGNGREQTSAEANEQAVVSEYTISY